MARKNRKIIFPAGIFLLLLLTESILGSMALFSYTYVSLKKNINTVEEYTRNYSKTLAEAFASVAELSLKTNKTGSLRTLFHEKIQEKTIDEAIFILADGRLIVHSNTSVEKALRGNIANDGIAYNLELILEPVRNNSRELKFSDYNIMDKKIPFSIREREIIAKYIYPGINTTGWLVTKSIFINDKPAGAVCFLTAKERIYILIRETFTHTLKYFYILLGASLAIALIISLVILARYRSIHNKAELMGSPPVYGRRTESSDANLTGNKSGEDLLIPATESPSGSIMDDFDPFDDEAGTDHVKTLNGKISHESATLEDYGLSDDSISGDSAESGNGYITVEFLGEINNEQPVSIAHTHAAGDYIARKISPETLGEKGIKEIRDAIPAKRGRA
ncbi:MAG TPA: hypothetical protein PK986_04000 [Spirochaetota bacterium]|nr:hypothetical protein [Spirochaetota bacterium]HQO39610.1 hypothetical protein [Spirochaetota bacterium]